MKKNTNKIVPIVFAVDDNYVPFLCVALKSIICNASKDYEYRVHILNTGLNNKSVKEIKKFANINFTIEFNNVEKEINELGNVFHTRDYYTKSTYFRMFIPRLFKEYNKALYLDADIIVRCDISEFFNFDIKNNFLGAIPDEAVNTVPEFIDYANDFLGIKESNYFNAGILIMNLEALRKANFENKFLDLIKTVKFTVAQDQDYLNVICRGKVTYLPSVYNKMPFKCNNVPVEDLKIIHYNLNYKPWHYDDIMYEEEFWKYAVTVDCINDIFEIKSSYSSVQKQMDFENGERLKQMAKAQADDKNSFKNLLLNGDIVVQYC